MLKEYDVVLVGGRVIDPKQGLDTVLDVAVRDGRIVEISSDLAPYVSKETISVEGKIVCPGLIDLHAHFYEWFVTDSLCADDIGVNAGVTTIVDQGDCGSATFLGFKKYIADKSITDVRCFPCINIAGTVSPDSDKTALYGPDMVDIEASVALAAQHQDVIRGFKVHGESAALSRWGTKVIEMGRMVADATALPLYMHTGVLFDVLDSNRPDPEGVIPKVLPFLNPGDMITHCYGHRQDGILGDRAKAPKALVDAVRDGVLLDLGHGVHFSFAVARRMLEQGLRAYTISSDAHGDFTKIHDDGTLNYSLCGIMSKFMALGFTLEEVIACTTYHPAKILRAESEIGTLQNGSRADITILDKISGDWQFYDSLGEGISVSEKLVPTLVIREGNVIHPHGKLLRDINTDSKMPAFV